MSDSAQTSAPAAPVDTDHRPSDDGPGAADLIDQDLLVEEVSIDGMCGVY